MKIRRVEAKRPEVLRLIKQPMHGIGYEQCVGAVTPDNKASKLNGAGIFRLGLEVNKYGLVMLSDRQNTLSAVMMEARILANRSIDAIGFITRLTSVCITDVQSASHFPDTAATSATTSASSGWHGKEAICRIDATPPVRRGGRQ